MDWIAALCLSVPIAVAAYVAAAWCAQAAHARDAAVAQAALRAARVAAKATRDAAKIQAEAHVKAAKYASGFTRSAPKKEAPQNLTPFQRWFDAEGRHKPAHVAEAVEFAFAYIAGEDSGAEAGDYASPEKAKQILDEHAGPGWYGAAVEDAKSRRA